MQSPTSPRSWRAALLADGAHLRLASIGFALLALATLAIYWPGLNGPFLLDDGVTFPPIQRWLAGQASLAEAVLGRGSQLTARPVAMASFALSAMLGGDTPFSFKLGNLILHVLCGLLVWQLVRRLLELDPRLAARAPFLATIASGLWLLHPIQVSTVLYSVQRMAQLSTALVLAAVLLYLLARRELAEGRVRSALFKLFVTFPLLVVLGLLSKQNAAVAPLICLAIELSYFGFAGKGPVRAFFAAFVLLPGTAVLASLLLAPDWLLGGYAEWDFSPMQRLLSEARALTSYLGLILWPRGPGMGVYTDDFALSTGLFSPPATALSVLALLAASAGAAYWRKAAPSLCAGWFAFLAAHAVESSLLPVELYYEHRNYLPLTGLVLAAVGATALLPAGATTRKTYRMQLAGAALVIIVALATVTAGRVSVWRSLDSISAEGLREHPHSLRAIYDRGNVLLARGDIQGNLALMVSLAASEDPRHRLLGRLHVIRARCDAGLPVVRADYAGIAPLLLPKLTIFELQALRSLAVTQQRRGCAIAAHELGDLIAQAAETAGAQPESARPKWLVRLLAAETYARAGDLAAAETQARIGWSASGDLPTGVLLAKILAARGAREDAARIWLELDSRIKPYDSLGRSELAQIRAMLTAPAP
ncbi:hypothetical protein [Lysobacter sp. cf310]|uniref:hypothetical protein n=1 Tax=Lysobacter sp. cf310 TaxID=1761790 RepID=UPI0008EB215B|nr:hypothetical protein [Lysobacter sp. cf310]SFK41695.1 hypothetical protein SAMN04487938_0750 [Lysobacter sp. cf310]